MKRITKKSIVKASQDYRNQTAIKHLANIDDRAKDDYERLPLVWTPNTKVVSFSAGIWNFMRQVMQP